MLIGVLVLVALVLITLAVAAPRVASELQRDKEDELMHRGLQYARAIRLYYKKFGRYPSSLDQLEKTNEIRFLRKRYKDPVTGKDEWRLIHFGEAKVKPTGLFGQALQGADAGTGGTGGVGVGGMGAGSAGTAGSSAFGAQRGLGASSAFGSSSTLGGSSFGSGASTTSAATDGQAGSSTATGGIGASGSAFGSAFGSTGSATGSGSSSTSAFGSPASSATSGIGGTGQTFGGAGIVGVSSTSPKVSIREFKKQKHYNEWEFVYNPMQDQQGQNGQNGTGILMQPGATNPNSPISIGSPGFGTSTPGGGTTPTPTTPSPTP
jgi:type II secretory pathway pseudopilin PulG